LEQTFLQNFICSQEINKCKKICWRLLKSVTCFQWELFEPFWVLETKFDTEFFLLRLKICKVLQVNIFFDYLIKRKHRCMSFFFLAKKQTQKSVIQFLRRALWDHEKLSCENWVLEQSSF
jgi:hypothetical protein